MRSDRRMGSFEIPMDMIDNHPNAVREILRETIVVRAEARYDTARIHYTGIGPFFDEINWGEMPNDYVCHVESGSRDANSQLSVTWTKEIGSCHLSFKREEAEANV